LSKQPGFKTIADSVVHVDGAISQAQLWQYLDAIRNDGGEVIEILRPRPSLQDVFVKAIGAGAEEVQ
jgi:hypothetical protein